MKHLSEAQQREIASARRLHEAGGSARRRVISDCSNRRSIHCKEESEMTKRTYRYADHLRKRDMLAEAEAQDAALDAKDAQDALEQQHRDEVDQVTVWSVRALWGACLIVAVTPMSVIAIYIL